MYKWEKKSKLIYQFDKIFPLLSSIPTFIGKEYVLAKVNDE